MTDLGPITQNSNLYMNGGPGHGGPWSWYSNDPISMVAQQPSPLEAWLPFRLVSHQKETVSHLSYIVAQGWDGNDDTYKEMIDGMEIEECMVSDLRAKFDGCQYNIPFGESSASSGVLRAVEDMGMREYEMSQTVRVRTAPGQEQYATVDNKSWQISLATIAFQNHMKMNTAIGVRDDNVKMWSDGLGEVIRLNYVADHKVGDISCEFSDPVVLDGSTYATAEDLLLAIQGEVSRIMNLSEVIGLPINVGRGDIVIGISKAAWATLSTMIAVGGLIPVPKDWVTGGMTPALADGMRQRLLSGGFGYGHLPVNGMEIPILPLDEFARNTNGNTTITGDIFVLTRNAGGINALELQYYDYGKMNLPNKLYTYHQGGGMRMRVLNVNDDCYKWAIDSRHRLISRLQPLQSRITSATVRVLGNHRLENAFYGGSHYVNQGVPGSIGAGWGQN